MCRLNSTLQEDTWVQCETSIMLKMTLSSYIFIYFCLKTCHVSPVRCVFSAIVFKDEWTSFASTTRWEEFLTWWDVKKKKKNGLENMTKRVTFFLYFFWDLTEMNLWKWMNTDVLNVRKINNLVKQNDRNIWYLKHGVMERHALIQMEPVNALKKRQQLWNKYITSENKLWIHHTSSMIILFLSKSKLALISKITVHFIVLLMIAASGT